MSDREEWVIWNGALGILVMAAIGHVERGAGRRTARLAPPWDVVGPFDLDELEANGCVAYGECLVMSRRKWADDQVALRLEARNKRRAVQFEPDVVARDDHAHREELALSGRGVLDAAEINAAFRRRAKAAHPDAGGSNERYRRIAEARDALLKQARRAS